MHGYQNIPPCDIFIQAALSLAAEGINVFPAVYREKIPATERGFYDASTNPATIRRWFGGGFKKNLAARTGQVSGCWVLDIDCPDALHAFQDVYEQLPATRQSQSARGWHLWFKTTAIPIPSSSGRVWPSIDVKAEGGYVIAPPSIHPTGSAYEWVQNVPIAEAPSWLLVLARKPTPQHTPAPISDAPRTPCGRYGQVALERETMLLACTPKGERNNQLNRSAFSLFQLVAGGVLQAVEVVRRLVEACVANGLVDDDGLNSVMKTIRSGERAGLTHPRGRP